MCRQCPAARHMCLLRAQPKIPAEEMRPTLLFFRGKCTPLKYNWKNNADNMGKLMRFHVRLIPGLRNALAALASMKRWLERSIF